MCPVGTLLAWDCLLAGLRIAENPKWDHGVGEGCWLWRAKRMCFHLVSLLRAALDVFESRMGSTSEF